MITNYLCLLFFLFIQLNRIQSLKFIEGELSEAIKQSSEMFKHFSTNFDEAKKNLNKINKDMDFIHKFIKSKKEAA